MTKQQRPGRAGRRCPTGQARRGRVLRRDSAASPEHARTFRDIGARCARRRRQADDLSLHLPIEGSGAPDRLRRLLGNPPDLVVRQVCGMCVICLKTLVDVGQVAKNVVGPLQQALRGLRASPAGPAQPARPAASALRLGPALRQASPDRAAVRAALDAMAGMPAVELRRVGTYAQAVDALLTAQVVVVAAGLTGGWATPLEAWPERTPTEPPGEFLPQGPHLGFVETLETNVAMLRVYACDRHLRVEPFVFRGRSDTRGMLLYVRGLAHPSVLRRLRRQLRKVRPSFLTNSPMLGQWLTPRSGRIFPTIHATERPDHAAAALLEGRIVLLTQGSPVALMAPTVFVHLLQAPEDYSDRAPMAAVKRWIRALGLAVALLASPVFVGVLTLNQELLPTPLFLSLAQARLNVPLSVLAEVLVLELVVEVIREAGLRLPAPTGQSVAIIGAVVVGQAAVLAGLISAPSTVVVSLGFIASFILPSSNVQMAVRLVRFPLILAAGAFGLFGVALGLLVVIAYLASLESFGVPYLAPYSPLRLRGLQDTWLGRLPLWRMRRAFFARRSPQASLRRATIWRGIRRAAKARRLAPPRPTEPRGALPPLAARGAGRLSPTSGRRKPERRVPLAPHARRGWLTGGQLFWLLMLSTFPAAILVLPGDLVRIAGRWAWWTPLAAGVPITVLAAGMGRLAARSGDVPQAARRGLPPLLAGLTLCVGWVGTGLYAVEAAREFAEVAGTLYVAAQLPTALLAALGLAVAAWLAWLGPVVVARTAALVAPAVGAIFVLVLVGALPSGHLIWSLPLWPRDLRFAGWPALGRAWAWLASPVWVVAVLGGRLDGPPSRTAGGMSALAAGTGAVVTAVGLWVMIVDGGPARISQFLLPFLNIADGLSAGPFVQHLGTLVMPVLLIGDLVRLAVFLLAWGRVAEALGLRGGWVAAAQALLAGAAGQLGFANLPEVDLAAYRWLAPLVHPALVVAALLAYATGGPAPWRRST